MLRGMRAQIWAIPLALATCGGVLPAQSLYKYRDASGAWVYTDRQPPAGTTAQTMAVDLEAKAPRITVEQSVDDRQLRLLAINDCACEAEYAVQIDSPGNVSLPALSALPALPALPDHADAGMSAGTYHVELRPHSRLALLSAPYAGSSVVGFHFSWRVVLGAPGATHRPREAYRVPFALGASCKVSQAYPLRITHVTTDTEYAVDLAVPDGTPIYAAREGTVINVRHDAFRGAPDPAMLDQANVVEILHDDGTIAMYAHLHWESIRVQPGQSVRRGQYIADSGNTGLTTGPHLHFAVIRNAGMRAESIAVQFTGAGGVAITPQTGMTLTAY
jgi:murein DD-endopeptidase MepM/ murein hydrolase activator NlpD